MTLEYISNRINNINTSEIRKMFALAEKMKNPINLSIGQPDFPVPQVVKDAYIKAIQDNKNAYTQTMGIMPLRVEIAKKYLTKNVVIEPENILISSGTSPILMTLFQTTLNKGDKILILDPYFLMYEALADYHEVEKFYLKENFIQEDIDTLIKNNDLKNLKLIIFSSPSNPTGKILSQTQIELIGNLAEKYNALIISDEIYEAYDYDNKHISTASLFPERTLTLNGFSKSHAMTGLRVGYIAAHQKYGYIIDKMATLQQYSVVCAPQPAQWAAITALQTPITNELNIMKNRRKIVLEYLEDKLDFSYPDGAFYIFPTIKEDCRIFVQKAIEKELLIVPGYIFTKNYNTIRISYAQSEEKLREGLSLFCSLL